MRRIILIIYLTVSIMSCSMNQDNKANYIFKADSNKLQVHEVQTKMLILEIKKLDCAPQDYYRLDNRFFYRCENNEIWEIEIELQRVMQVDLTVTELKKYKN